MALNPQAVVTASQKLWQNNPNLNGRQLTLNGKDSAYRQEWLKYYHEAVKQIPKPPPPKINPQPVTKTPPPVVATDPTLPCGKVATMTHEEKMEAAIKKANLAPEILEELGDIKTLVATLVIVGGILAAIAATGYGAVAEAIGLGLLIIDAYMSGNQIGEGINSMMDFFQKTRCDSAKTEEDLAKAGKSFANGIAKIGIGGLNLLLSLAGGRKAPAKVTESPLTKLPSPKVQLEEIYVKAPEAKSEIDVIAKSIASKTGGKVAEAPLKGKDRILEKAIKDYKGNVSEVKDIARNTIVVEKNQYDKAIVLLEEQGASVKIKNPSSDELGYSGANTIIQTKSGISAEIQVNTPEMIFAKEKPADAIKILGEERYAQIAAKTGMPGGRGHLLYERWRSLPPGDPQIAQIEAESRAYYNQIRKLGGQ